MIAHYLVFIGITVDSIFIWIGYFIARWVIKTQLSDDITILFKAPGHSRLTEAIGSGMTLVRFGSNMKPDVLRPQIIYLKLVLIKDWY